MSRLMITINGAQIQLCSICLILSVHFWHSIRISSLLPIKLRSLTKHYDVWLPYSSYILNVSTTVELRVSLMTSHYFSFGRQPWTYGKIVFVFRLRNNFTIRIGNKSQECSPDQIARIKWFGFICMEVLFGNHNFWGVILSLLLLLGSFFHYSYLHDTSRYVTF